MAVIKTQTTNRNIDSQNAISGTLSLANYSNLQQVCNAAGSLSLERVPFDIQTFLKKHTGVKIEYEEMDMELSGFVEKKNDVFIIGVNKYQNPQRQRFTMAHELAHIVLHYEQGNEFNYKEKILFRDKSVNIQEREANELAAELLMPRETFVEFIRNGYNTIEKLAEVFNVSPAAARYRAYKLGYLKEY